MQAQVGNENPSVCVGLPGASDVLDPSGAGAGSLFESDLRRPSARDSAPAAASTLSVALIRRLPSRPYRGSNHHVVSRAPAAAPSVLYPYSAPVILAALLISVTSARASRGNDMPMKKVGHSRLTKRIAAIASGVAACCPKRR